VQKLTSRGQFFFLNFCAIQTGLQFYLLGVFEKQTKTERIQTGPTYIGYLSKHHYVDPQPFKPQQASLNLAASWYTSRYESWLRQRPV